jgi:hypothetical protein
MALGLANLGVICMGKGMLYNGLDRQHVSHVSFLNEYHILIDVMDDDDVEAHGRRADP